MHIIKASNKYFVVHLFFNNVIVAKKPVRVIWDIREIRKIVAKLQAEHLWV